MLNDLLTEARPSFQQRFYTTTHKRPLTEVEWSFLYAITKRSEIDILRH
ncbi:hypothetical protein QP156_10895 [Staphylococcus caprae]|nr:hypothetical protein [Staphylococcus caprae]